MTAQSQTLTALKEDLVSAMDLEQVFQKHIIDGRSFFFSEYLKDSNREYTVRHSISTTLGLSINDVVIVGSAKLGFSVKTDKFLNFDERFRRTNKKEHLSDIDVAIVSKKLFDEQKKLDFEISRHFDSNWEYQNWRHNFFYKDDAALRKNSIDTLFHSYTKNIARGWLRVDYTPSIYINAVPWKECVNDWRNKLSRKISIAIYSDWDYLKHYQMDNLEQLRIKTAQLDL